jgi:hypothetical protein
MAAFTRAASRTRGESCRGVNGVSSASSTLTLDRALGVANQSDIVSASDPGRVRGSLGRPWRSVL